MSPRLTDLQRCVAKRQATEGGRTRGVKHGTQRERVRTAAQITPPHSAGGRALRPTAVPALPRTRARGAGRSGDTKPEQGAGARRGSGGGEHDEPLRFDAREHA